MQAHFIISGFLCLVLIGIDPRDHCRTGVACSVLLALAVHGFFAVAFMMGTTPMAVSGTVVQPWSPIAASRLLGGQVLGLSRFPV